MRVTAPIAVRIRPQTSLWSSHCITSTDDGEAEALRLLLRVDVGSLFLRVMACQVVCTRARGAQRARRKKRASPPSGSTALGTTPGTPRYRPSYAWPKLSEAEPSSHERSLVSNTPTLGGGADRPSKRPPLEGGAASTGTLRWHPTQPPGAEWPTPVPPLPGPRSAAC